MDDVYSNPALKALENLRMRLLDLTGRNRLINFKHTKKGSLRIIDELPDQLVATLLAESEMRFVPVPEPTREELIADGYIEIDPSTEQEVRLRKDPTAEEWATRKGLKISYEVPEPSPGEPAARHADTAIQTLLFPYELEARLKGLMQTAESAIQEMGANILYLAFGFLEWNESKSSSASIAPLFLVPVRLQKGRLNPQTRTYEYRVSYSGEDIIPNLSLREKLRADFHLALPDLDENTTPESYFNEVQELLAKNQPDWRLRRFITLTLLNFGKLLMYLDLDPSRWPKGKSITDHRVAMRFLDGYNNVGENEHHSEGDFGFGEEYTIDEMEDINTRYPLIEDADSSQYSALIDAVDGKDLVIEGPPGTGKSQTITNLIAACMAQGKRVLFVAEKLAALEVVRHRLDQAGLGDFCLELHSHKTQKRKVLDEIEARLKKRGKYRDPKEIDVDITRYEELKKKLKGHAERINRLWKNTGKTPHEIFMAATRFRGSLQVNPEALHPVGHDGNSLDLVTQRRAEDQVETYRKVYKGVVSQLNDDSALERHPWFGVRNTEFQYFDLDRVITALEDWQDSLKDLSSQRNVLAKELGVDGKYFAKSVNTIHSVLEDLENFPPLHGDELLDRISILRGEALSKVQQYLKLFEDIQGLYLRLGGKIDPEILEDLSKIDDFLHGSHELASLVGKEIELTALAEAANRLSAIRSQLDQLNEPLEHIQSAIGREAAKHISATTAGLEELQIFIERVSDLPARYWKLIDPCFDSDELDELLPALRTDLSALHVLHDEIADYFRLDALPPAEELKQTRNILENGGLFHWLKSDWRSERKKLLGLAKNTQVKFATLLTLLGKAEEYAESNQALLANPKYREAFGPYLNGLETDITALGTMRAWYQSIRQEYGIGFGPRVVIGEAVLALSPSTARAIRSLAEQGLRTKIDDILNDLRDLRTVFSPVLELQSEDTVLSGPDGVIVRIQTSLDEALEACKPLLNDDSTNVEEVIHRIELLGWLKKAFDKWTGADFDNKLFDGHLGLRPGANIDNSAGIRRLRNTLAVAEYIDQQITADEVRQYVYNHPHPNTIASLKSHSINLRRSVDKQSGAFEGFRQLTHLDVSHWIRHPEDHVEAIIERNGLALTRPESLPNWIDYVRARMDIEAQGLGPLAERVELGDIDHTQIRDAYKAGLYDLLAREVFREEPEIGRFSGHSQEALRDQFREYDDRLKALQCEKIAWQIDQVIVPAGISGVRVSELTDLALLQHETSKKTRHRPIRQLLKRAGDALVSMKPCFMMGPMSVAQYLEPGQIEFDLVVMDEASQIKPQDALGAVARGGQLVVVGDPKQLPPTSFFDRAVDDEEDDPTAIEESESILDATLPIFPARRLRWHYRSQHESLIAFSNHFFYESDLVLFPSPHKNTDQYGIQYSRIPRGCFVNRRNMEEARIIAEAVREHLRHRPDESLGVVAMSAEQRLQIEVAIEALARDDEVLQGWLDENAYKDEPLFVKNLENVQGDERDVIFISMTYGPQEPGGKVYQRFGPINSDVGWRRLNVLFTRSKKRMHIFSSMASDDIVVGPSSKRGVQSLRDFLAFCETGILHATEPVSARPPDSDFEITVINALRDAGFDCVPQVGVAGFFIDIGVLDPGNPGRYLMGIECDGATYHSAKSTRDRDRLRQTILERLGWKIRRIWSTDWFKNPHAELQPIVRELNSLKTVGSATDGLQGAQIDEIVEAVDHQESHIENYLSEDLDIKEKLVRFDTEIIRKQLPATPEHQRLLRPAMLEAFVEYRPCSRAEFLEYIPSYLRQATSHAEGRYLDDLFEIINSTESERLFTQSAEI